MGIKNFLKSIWNGTSANEVEVPEIKMLTGKSGIRYILPLNYSNRIVLIEGIIEEFPEYQLNDPRFGKMSDMELINLHETAFAKGAELIASMLKDKSK